MGNYGMRPVMSINSENGQWIDFSWTSGSMQGFRTSMLNYVSNSESLAHLRTFSLFLVFEGQDGLDCSWNASRGLAKFIASQEILQAIDDESSFNPNAIKELLTRSIMKYDVELKKIIEFPNLGSTISGVLITPDNFYIINLGNSKVILCRDQKAYFQTLNHDLKIKNERDRILEAGGRISSNFINGRLSVTRSLGNFDMKQSKLLSQGSQIISAEPEITIIPRMRNSDDFIIIATNGINKILSNDDLVNFVRQRIPVKNSIGDVCNEVINYCLHKKSIENLTLTIVHFDQSKIQKDEERVRRENVLVEGMKRQIKQHFMKMEFPQSFRDTKKCVDQIIDENDFLSSCRMTTGLFPDLKRSMMMSEISRLREDKEISNTN